MKQAYFLRKARWAVCALFTLTVFTACGDDDETLLPPPAQPAVESALVLNQGSMYSGISSTMDALNLTDGTYTSSVFSAINGSSLGDNAIDGVAHGSKVYIAMYGSDLVWAIDRNTLKVQKGIPTNDPEGICAAGKYVYVSNNDGFVSRIDTTTLTVDKRIEVGPNPAHLTVSGDYLYVSISDGYNYDEVYINGYRVAKVSLSTFTKEKDLKVGVNPGPICTDSDGTVFVVSRGNYADVAPMAYRITQNDEVTEFCQASNIAVKGTTLYTIYNYTDWTQSPAATTLTYAAYDTRTGLPTAFNLDPDHLPAAPIDLDIDPVSGDLYIGSNASSYDYTTPGYVYRYSANGTFKSCYPAGVAPCAVVFK